MPIQVLGSDKILRMNDFNLLGLVQSYDWSPNFNAEDIFEMGRDTKVATALELETTGSLELGAMGGLPGLLARTIVTRNSSGYFTGYEYDPLGAEAKNGYTFNQNSFREPQFDLVIHEKTDQVTYDRSVVLPRCYVTSVSGRADATGIASDTINFAGDFVVGAVTPYHDVRALPATVDTLNNQLILSDATVTSTDYAIMYAFIDNVRLRTVVGDGQYVTLEASGGKVTVTGLDLDDFKRATCRVILYKTTSPSTTFPVLADVDRDTTAFYVKGYQVDIFIAPADDLNPTSSEKWLRVQSMDYNMDFRMETLRELQFNTQGSSIYARVPTFPFDISLNATVYETDWEDWKAVMNKTFPGTDVYQDTFDLSPTNLKEKFAVVVQYKTKSGSLLQTWRFKDMRLDGYGNRANIGGRGEITWPLRGTELQLVGANV